MAFIQKYNVFLKNVLFNWQARNRHLELNRRQAVKEKAVEPKTDVLGFKILKVKLALESSTNC